MSEGHDSPSLARRANLQTVLCVYNDVMHVLITAGNTLVPTGRKSANFATPGNSYTELFRGGDLERTEPGTLPFGPNGEEWQVDRVYAWSGGVFRQVSTNQFTAATELIPASSPMNAPHPLAMRIIASRNTPRIEP